MAAIKRKVATKRAASRATSKAKKTSGKASMAAKRASVRQTAASASSMKQATDKVVSMVAQPEAIMKLGTDAIRQMMNQANNSKLQQDVQKQMMNMSQESAAQLAKSADVASRSMSEMMALSKDNMDAAVTCSSIAVNASKCMGAELFNYANKSFSQNVEMSKEIFGCRTINDMFDLQSKVMKANLDHFFNESVKMSEMLFQCANEVSEPINERVSENTSRLSRVLTEAA